MQLGADMREGVVDAELLFFLLSSFLIFVIFIGFRLRTRVRLFCESPQSECIQRLAYQRLGRRERGCVVGVYAYFGALNPELECKGSGGVFDIGECDFVDRKAFIEDSGGRCSTTHAEELVLLFEVMEQLIGLGVCAVESCEGLC